MTRGALLDANVLVAPFDERDDASETLSADVRTALDDALSDPEARLRGLTLISEDHRIEALAQLDARLRRRA